MPLSFLQDGNHRPICRLVRQGKPGWVPGFSTILSNPIFLFPLQDISSPPAIMKPIIKSAKTAIEQDFARYRTYLGRAPALCPAFPVQPLDQRGFKIGDMKKGFDITRNFSYQRVSKNIKPLER
jgi:hypothetical protein